MSLTQKHAEVRGVRRLVIAVACGAVALITCASALALRMNVTDMAMQDQPSAQTAPKRIAVSAEVMAANKISGNIPKYPEDAKKARVSGVVTLAVIIDQEGTPTDVQVKESPSPMLTQSAIDAVQDWRWKPYLLNGNPVEVETEVNVTYSLEK